MLDSNRQNLRRKLSNRHASSRCAALRPAEPHRLPAAVEELLRFAGPLQVALPCRTTEPVELGGGDDSQWSWAG